MANKSLIATAPDQPLNKEEASDLLAKMERAVDNLETNISDLRRHCWEFKHRRGWRALGYKTLEECVKKEFSHGIRRFYELTKSVEVAHDIVKHGGENVRRAHILPEKTLRPLGSLKSPEERATVFEEAVRLAGSFEKVDSRHVKEALGAAQPQVERKRVKNTAKPPSDPEAEVERVPASKRNLNQLDDIKRIIRNLSVIEREVGEYLDVYGDPYDKRDLAFAYVENLKEIFLGEQELVGKVA